MFRLSLTGAPVAWVRYGGSSVIGRSLDGALLRRADRPSSAVLWGGWISRARRSRGSRCSAGRIGAVDLEALGGAVVLMREPHIMEHRACVEKLRVEA